jgi:hypothetical protein
VLHLELLDIYRHVLQAANDVVDQTLLGVRHHQAEKIAGLRVIIIPLTVIITSRIAGNF